MKYRIFCLLLLVILVPAMLFSVSKKKKSPAVEQLTWLTSFSQAQARSAEVNKPILIDFTGSDWCIWCQKLHKEVFSQKAFTDYAKNNVVLLKIDFPRSLPQTAEEKSANQALAKQYDIQGFPTVVLVDAQGKEIARTGYQEGGAQKYVEHLKGLLKTR